MDEMTAVRELRAGAPVPGAGRLAAGRRLLLDRIATPGEGRGAWRGLERATGDAGPPPPRPRRKGAVVLTATAVTGVLLVAGAVMQDTGRSHPSGAATSPATGEPHPSAPARPDPAAAQVLAAAASAADAAPRAATPAANQWLYTRTVRCQQKLCTTVDSWVRYRDGLRADVENPPANGSPPKKIDLYPATTELGWRPRVDRAWLASLPEEPRALLARLNSRDLEWPFPAPASARSPQFEFRRVLDVLAATQPTPPQYAAGLFRALALIPGVELRPGRTKDAAGREGVAIGFHGTQESLILDPATYAYRGENWILPDGTASPLTRTWALKSSGVVDHAGQRPGGPVPPPSSLVDHTGEKLGAHLPPGLLKNFAKPPGSSDATPLATVPPPGSGR